MRCEALEPGSNFHFNLPNCNSGLTIFNTWNISRLTVTTRSGPGWNRRRLREDQHWQTSGGKKNSQQLHLRPLGFQVRDCLLSSAVSSLGERAEAETLQPGEDHDQQQQRHHAGPAQPQQQLRGGVRAELLSCPGETKHTAGAQ